MGVLAGGRGSVSQKAGRTQVTQKRPSFPGTSPPPHTHKHTNGMYKVNQEPGRSLTNTHMDQTTWTTNLVAPHTQTATEYLTYAWDKQDVPGPAPPHTHTTAFSQTHGWNLQCGPGAYPLSHTHRAHHLPLTNARMEYAWWARNRAAPPSHLHCNGPLHHLRAQSSGTRTNACSSVWCPKT